MSDVTITPVPEGVEMNVKYLANSQEIKPSYVGTSFMFILAFLIPAVPIAGMICYLAGCFAPTFTFENSGGFLVFGVMAVPIAVTMALEIAQDGVTMAEDSLENKSKLWLSEQGHQLSEKDEKELDCHGEIIVRDITSGVKIKIEQQDTYQGSRILSYTVLKKPKAKPAPSERKPIQLFQSFTPSAMELIESIQGRGKQLLTLPLSVEDQHAVERVLSDVEELNKLGSVTQGAEPTKLQMRTLKTLNKEMKSLAANVNNSMVKQLKIHASYVEERNRTRSELSLDPRTRKTTS